MLIYCTHHRWTVGSSGNPAVADVHERLAAKQQQTENIKTRKAEEKKNAWWSQPFIIYTSIGLHTQYAQRAHRTHMPIAGRVSIDRFSKCCRKETRMWLGLCVGAWCKKSFASELWALKIRTYLPRLNHVIASLWCAVCTFAVALFSCDCSRRCFHSGWMACFTLTPEQTRYS